ncbi:MULTISPECIES: nucleoid-associated protein [unclassified Cobetia]|uniref:nucleoid-associated protein n=1 Tax=unclassified Cobetia TaxID=2609414 RepID=UPI00178CD283|nr:MULTISPECIES: nucleoid-associated protein [unclassified Cobetia]MBE2168773.1 nucleoid-associated protein [Cobetia sp. 2AS1]MDH2447659.1 nucleoid-associated protein [Cobetia sp. 2AS]
MSFVFDNLQFSRIILHNVYKPNSEGSVAPFLSKVLTELDPIGQEKLQQRISSVLGNGSHSLQMDIAQNSEVSCFHNAVKLLGSNDAGFISQSAALAELHTAAHTSQKWPGGTLIIIDGTAGAANKRCLFIIKAEQQAGFVEKEVDNKVVMEYLENLILTPQAKLYKVGVFVEVITQDRAEDAGNIDGFEAYVFDNNITAKDDRKAARYFYSGFLGLRVPENSEQLTRNFYEYTKNFINDSDMSVEDKVDLQQALHTYLKTDQKTTIQSSDFAESYMLEEYKDDYCHYLTGKNFPAQAILKDTSLIKRKLQHRKMSFSTSVRVIAPAESFDEMVQVLEVTDDYTKIQIHGTLTEQE